MTKQEAAQHFAAWLAQYHPDLFLAAYQHAKGAADQGVLGDLSDVLSSIGDTVGSAVSGVASWLETPNAWSTLGGLATSIITKQGQQSALTTQIARAQAAQPPLAISYNQLGQPVVPVTATGVAITTATAAPQVAGYVPATPSLLSQYMPANMTPVLLAGAAVLGLFLLLKLVKG